VALGKGPIALGKGFAECHTRQRANGKAASGEGFFAECHLSGTRQRLCRVPGRHSVKKIGRQPLTASLPSAGSGRHSTKLFPFFLKNPLPSAFLTRHSAKKFFFEKSFAECLPDPTLGKEFFLKKILCRVSS